MQSTIPNYSRRQFIRGSLAGAASLAALPAWAAPSGANGDIRVAVIGFNGRGAGHIGSLLKIPGVRIVALCDVDNEVLKKGVADLAKKNVTVKTYTDYRKCCEDKEIDAITIATPNHTHTLIAMTGIANGKHVYVEKPVCHNVTEGRLLVEAAAKVAPKGQIVQHGMQRRSSPGWQEAMEFVKSGSIGKLVLSRGTNYKARPTIGKVAAPIEVPGDGRIKGTFRDTGGKPQVVDVDYKLWSGPRGMKPLSREQFHYDWHWQWAYGNGDIGNQGPHQLDVARWALGNPENLPLKVMSFGNRWAYTDDGQTANNQLALYDFGPGVAPLLFDNRGLPHANLEWGKGRDARMPVFYATAQGKGGQTQIGNVIHCENGYVAESKAYDKEGTMIKKFENFNDGTDHMLHFIDSIRAGKLVDPNLHVSHGFHAAALAHLANISYRLGKKASPDEIKERLQGDKAATATFENFAANLAANHIDLAVDQAILGPQLGFDSASLKFTGPFADEANKLVNEDYVDEFKLPVIS
ncbi:MAG: Gfo/Idh/MocA family oxidoreductase [Verrucomicrobiaceae bacterium]|nr:Gfo/Idh/MocA family oxidoreductase [Verrucomicrobiaceae bacterium]